MTMQDEEKKRHEIVEFRYGIIAELANPYLGHGELQQRIRQKAELTYDIPHSSKDRITESCIKDWLKRFRKYGKQGLMPKQRSDRGKSRVMSDEEVHVLCEYLLAHPQVTATAGYAKLLKEGKIQTLLSSSSLSRIVVSQGIREQRSEHNGVEQMRKFGFFAPLECVQADCLHGPQVPDGKGRMKKAILIVFLDDATRRILYCKFSFSEHSLVFEKGLKHILKTHGKLYRVYVDQGSTFVSLQTQRILDILKVHLVHSRPRRPQGRGKVERLMRTIRDGFLRPLEIDTVRSLEDLNMRLHTWVETEYHRSAHRGLAGKKTPLDAWLEKASYVHRLDPTIDLDRVFYHEISRKVFNDSTITVGNTLYEVNSVLIGKTVRISYDPHQPMKRMLVSYDGRSYGEARLVDTYANSRMRRDITKTSAAEAAGETAGSHIAAGLAASRISHPGGKR